MAVRTNVNPWIGAGLSSRLTRAANDLKTSTSLNGPAELSDSSAPARLMGRPVIGVLPGVKLKYYVDRIRQCAGVPILLRPGAVSPEGMVVDLDGLLIPGGPDVHPSMYGEAVHGARVERSNQDLDRFKLLCIQTAFSLGTPMVGICLGHQLMNVAAGGSLVQHIDSHEGDRHTVVVRQDSQLARILGSTCFMVNSMHHQAVKEVGGLLKVSANTLDGVAEGIEHRDNPTQIGVQFHPERMRDQRALRLFQYLVDSAAQFRVRRLIVGPFQPPKDGALLPGVEAYLRAEAGHTDKV